MTCTDPGALHDIPAWCRLNGHRVAGTADGADYELVITIVVGGAGENG